MPSMTYVCKSCGLNVEYPASQSQDQQPVVNFDQHDDGVNITITPTEWVYDDQGRPVQVLRVQGQTRISHLCDEVLHPPGVNVNLPAMPHNPEISY